MQFGLKLKVSCLPEPPHLQGKWRRSLQLAQPLLDIACLPYLYRRRLI
jgi:hypothetical protein